MWKKHIAKLLVFAMVLSLLPFAAATGENTSSPAASVSADYAIISDVKVTGKTDVSLSCDNPAGTDNAYTFSTDTEIEPSAEGNVTVSFRVVSNNDSSVSVKDGSSNVTLENGVASLTIENATGKKELSYTIEATKGEETVATYTLKLSFTVAAATTGQAEITITGENTVEVDQTIQLTATVTGTDSNPTIQWSSLAENIATVDNTGKVTGVAAGSATIKATATVGTETVEATKTVSVTAANVPVTGVSLNTDKLQLKAGASEKLTATVAPSDATNKNVTWSSSATAVATVNNGEVSVSSDATAGQTATITVTTEDGGKTATCTVTVLAENAKPVTKVTLNESAKTLTAVNDTYQLEADVEPADADDTTITWSSDNEDVATVNQNGLVTAVANGTATITATAVSGKSASCTITVEIPEPEYTVTLEANGGTLSDGNTLTATADNEYKVTLPVPTREGYTFDGWYADAEFATKVTGDETISGPTTYYAKWVKPVTGVTLSGDKTVEEGKTVTLTATVAPADATNKDVTWKSGDETIATVDQKGVVTGVKAGKTTITVTTADGGKTAELQIEVTAKATEPENPAAEYAVTVKADPAEGGEATANITKAKAGDEVTVTIKVNDGYDLSSITNNDKKEETLPTDGKYTFTMPEKDVIVTVAFTKKLPNIVKEVAKAEVEAKDEVPADAPAEVKQVTSAAKDAIKNSTAPISQDLGNAIQNSIDESAADDGRIVIEGGEGTVTEAQIEIAKEKLNAENPDQVRTVIVPKIVIAVSNAATGTDGTIVSLSFKINAFAQVMVTTAEEGGDIKEIKEGSENGNAVKAGDDINLKNTTKAITIDLPLPTAFKIPTNPVVRHLKDNAKTFWHKAIPYGSGIRFTNSRGFSEFTVEDAAGLQAEYDGEYYKTLQEAVDVVAANGTITVRTSGATATVSRKITFTLKYETGVEKATIYEGNGYVVSQNGDTYTVTEKKPDDSGNDKPSTGGGGGGGGGSSKPAIKKGDQPEKPTTPTTTPGGGVAGFNDVATSAWYADSVKYVVDKGLFGGVGNGNFAPNANMTRAMMWTVLTRYMGVNTNTGSNWYEAARTWAMAQNISDGTMADGNVTREQFVTMLWRLSGEPAVGTSASFTDNGRISGYAKTAVDWAVAQGILNGYNDGSFRPQGSATRAEVAKMLTVFCQNADNAEPTETESEA